MLLNKVVFISAISFISCSALAGDESLILIESECETTGIETSSKELEDLKNQKITMSCDFEKNKLTCWKIDILKEGKISRNKASIWVYIPEVKQGDRFYLRNKEEDLRMMIDLKKVIFKSNFSAFDLKNFNLIERQCHGKIVWEKTYLKKIKQILNEK